MSARPVGVPPGPLFAVLGRREQEVVARFGVSVARRRGQVLCRRDAVAREAIVVVDGRAVAGGATAAVLGPGDLVGAHEVVERRPHGRTVVARTDMTLVVYDARELLELLEAAPTVAARIRARSVVDTAVRRSTRTAAIAGLSA